MAAPASGLYTIRVTAHHVPQAPQPFALVLVWTDARPAPGCPVAASPGVPTAEVKATGAAAATQVRHPHPTLFI